MINENVFLIVTFKYEKIYERNPRVHFKYNL